MSAVSQARLSDDSVIVKNKTNQPDVDAGKPGRGSALRVGGWGGAVQRQPHTQHPTEAC